MLMYCFNCECEVDEYDIIDSICPLCDGSNIAYVDDTSIFDIDYDEYEEDSV